MKRFKTTFLAVTLSLAGCSTVEYYEGKTDFNANSERSMIIYPTQSGYFAPFIGGVANIDYIGKLNTSKDNIENIVTLHSVTKTYRDDSSDWRFATMQLETGDYVFYRSASGSGGQNHKDNCFRENAVVIRLIAGTTNVFESEPGIQERAGLENNTGGETESISSSALEAAKRVSQKWADLESDVQLVPIIGVVDANIEDSIWTGKCSGMDNLTISEMRDTDDSAVH